MLKSVIILIIFLWMHKVLCKQECNILCPSGMLPGGSPDDSWCTQLVYLNDPCESGFKSRSVCQDTYSSCQNGRCKCLHGFTEFDGHCKPDSVICPGSIAQGPLMNPPCSVTIDNCKSVACALGHQEYNDASCYQPVYIILPPSPCPKERPNCHKIVPPLKGIGTDLTIISRLNDDFGCLPTGFSPLKTKEGGRRGMKPKEGGKRGKRQSQLYEDKTCPRNQFCYTYAAYKFSDCKIRAFGHCCNEVCPVGLPHPNATCERDAPIRCQDQDGYFCSRSYISEPVALNAGRNMDEHFLATCCPSHCPRGMIALNDGHCIRKAQAGQSCWRNEQCPFSLSCTREICACKESEHLKNTEIGARCFKEFKMLVQHNVTFGLACNRQNETCERPNSVCDKDTDTGSYKCMCACGYEDDGTSCALQQRSFFTTQQPHANKTQRSFAVKTTTAGSVDCQDSVDYCTEQHCDRAPGKYLSLCKKTCNNCDGTKCYDSKNGGLNCESYRKTGFCSSKSMRDHCPKTCGFC